MNIILISRGAYLKYKFYKTLEIRFIQSLSEGLLINLNIKGKNNVFLNVHYLFNFHIFLTNLIRYFIISVRLFTTQKRCRQFTGAP